MTEKEKIAGALDSSPQGRGDPSPTVAGRDIPPGDAKATMDGKQKFEVARDLIRHEDGLINNRVIRSAID